MLVILEDAQKDHSHVSGEIAKPFLNQKKKKNAFKEAHKKKQVTWKKPQKERLFDAFLGLMQEVPQQNLYY